VVGFVWNVFGWCLGVVLSYFYDLRWFLGLFLLLFVVMCCVSV